MNITNLLNGLHIGVNNTSDPVDLLILSKAIEQLNMGKVSTVATASALPSAFSNEGQLYFVVADERLYWSTGGRWRQLSAPNNTAWGWGSNGYGRLGSTGSNRSSPTSVVGGFTDWCQVSAGNAHTAAVRQNGTLWAWGLNTLGRLGDNSVTSRASPVSVVGGFTDWCQVSAGFYHTAAVRQNGTLWAWGCGASGRLGDSTTVDKSSPVSVVGGFTDWCQVSAGNAHTAAVRQNGTLWAWGSNSSGQLGDGTITSRLSPVSVVGGFTDWCQVSVAFHTAAVRQNGTLWAWGLNTSGILGDGTAIANKSSPVSVVGGFTDWCQVSAGNVHTAAVRQNGTLWSWGCNADGRLGDGATANRSSPGLVAGGFTDWCQVSAGGGHTAAVRQNGTLWAWGCNSCGQLGNGSTVCSSSPISIVGGFADWYQVSAGIVHTQATRVR